MASADPLELSRRERRKLEMRNRILDAAFALFETHGFQATRVQEICARADVAHKTFFNYFPSKQHVMRELGEVALHDLLEDIEEARKRNGSTGERLVWLFDHIAQNSEDAGPMRRELIAEMIQAAHDSGAESEQARKLHGAFEALVRDGLAAGDVTTAHTAETLAEVLMGGFYVLMLHWASLDGYPLRDRARAAARFMSEAITATPQGGRE